MSELKLSNNPLHQNFAQRALCYIDAGGADFGEFLVTMSNIGEGDWYDEWITTASRIEAIGDESLKKGHKVSAREAYLRAANYYHAAYMPLFGYPVDERLKKAFEKEVEVFQRATTLFDSPVEILEIPFENTTLPAYFIKVDNSGVMRPTVIHTNGYDSNIQEMYFAHATAALKRGYNCLLFDGPGQGRNLIRDNMPLRPDWENVVKPVVDYALTRKEIDPKKIVLSGWSFGGFLAPRAAAHEHRIAALIADPGQWDVGSSLSSEKLAEMVRADPMMHWKIIQRGFWAHNVSTLEEFYAAMQSYKISDVAANISCPTFITQDQGAQQLFDAIKVTNERLVNFTESEGGGGHCEMLARSLYNQRVFDWLDEVLKV